MKTDSKASFVRAAKSLDKLIGRVEEWQNHYQGADEAAYVAQAKTLMIYQRNKLESERKAR